MAELFTEQLFCRVDRDLYVIHKQHIPHIHGPNGSVQLWLTKLKISFAAHAEEILDSTGHMILSIEAIPNMTTKIFCFLSCAAGRKVQFWDLIIWFHRHKIVNTCNICVKQHENTYCNIRLKQLKHLEHIVATYVWNITFRSECLQYVSGTDEIFGTHTCCIQIKHLQLPTWKHLLQHKTETAEIIETYSCNMYQHIRSIQIKNACKQTSEK